MEFNFTEIKKSRNWRQLLREGIILPPETTPSYYGYKVPLRKVTKGFGYQGVITSNAEKTHIQCHICGYYYSYLGKHLLTHGTNTVKYKEVFGLMKTASLLGEALREKRIQAQLNVSPELKERRRQHLIAVGKANKGKPYKRHKYSLEKKNKLGLCPDQILDRINQLAEIKGRTPTMKEYVAHYKCGVSHIVGTYDTWNNAVRLAGLMPSKVGQAHKKYTVASLLLLLEDFEQRHNRYPSHSDVRRGLIPSAWVWSTYFNGLNKAIGILKENSNV